MLAALDESADTNQVKDILWIGTGETDQQSADFSHHWLTTHTRVTEAETTSAITPFLLQNVS